MLKAVAVFLRNTAAAIAAGIIAMLVATIAFQASDEISLMAFSVAFLATVIAFLWFQRKAAPPAINLGSTDVRTRILRWLLVAFIALVVLGLLFPAGSGHVPNHRSLAKIDVLQASAALRQYRTEYGVLPIGQNAELMATLRGANPRKLAIFEAPVKAFNRKGELIDPWKTPYRFDLSDPENPRVWSCGKNRRDDGGAEGSDDIPSWR